MSGIGLDDYFAEDVQIGLNDNGCGHKIFMGRNHMKLCMDEGRGWYCTVCGIRRVFLAETLANKLRRERDAAVQREETIRQQRDEALVMKGVLDAQLKRAKKRIAAGVCPCCHRTVRQMARHIKTKHPNYAANRDGAP